MTVIIYKYRNMLLYGASGHAKVIIDCLESKGEKVTAIFDDDVAKTELLGYQVSHDYLPAFHPDKKIIIAIGDNLIRKRLAEGKIKHPFGTVVHASALISGHAALGDGTVVFHGGIVQTGSRLGKHVIINTGASVDHDCLIGDYVHIAPHATLCGGITIGEGTLIGAGAVVLPNLHIGRWCIIGAGTVVTGDVPDYSTVVGNPGRRKGSMK